MMKIVKIFSLLTLGFLMLTGCNSIDDREVTVLSLPESSDFDTELDYFEAKFEIFKENLISLELELEEIIDGTQLTDIQHIQLESRLLSELIKEFELEFGEYLAIANDAFRSEICLENNGEWKPSPYGDFYHCSLMLALFQSYIAAAPYCPERERLDRIAFHLFDFRRHLDRLYYFYPVNSLADVENRLDELEILAKDLEFRLQERLSYIEINSAYLWDKLQTYDSRIFGFHFFNELDFFNDDELENIFLEGAELIHKINGIQYSHLEICSWAYINLPEADSPNELPDFCYEYALVNIQIWQEITDRRRELLNRVHLIHNLFESPFG